MIFWKIFEKIIDNGNYRCYNPFHKSEGAMKKFMAPFFIDVAAIADTSIT